MKKEQVLKVIPAIGLAACLAVSAPALGSTKRAADLASMCADEALEAQERCIGYIQGYLDALQLSAGEEQTSWSQRAINTRIGTKLKAEQLRILLALMVLVVCFKLALDLLIMPSELYSLGRNGGH